MRQLRTLATITLVASLVAAACGSSEDTDSSESSGADATTTTSLVPQAGGSLAFGISLESIGWQPAASLWDPPGYVVASSFFDRLTAYGADGEIHPYLAEAIESDDDFTTWTITLREGVEFHDGTPLDAEALSVHFDQMRASLIWGPSLGFVQETEVIDDRTLEVTMTRPFSTFPHVLSAQPGFVAAPSQYEDPDGARQPVGTGPFVFEEWDQDSHLTVRRNDNYWRDDLPLLDEITFRVIPDPTERRRLLETGDLDIMEATAADDIADLEANADYQVFLDSEGENSEMSAILNTGRPPFQDPTARDAVALGIDKQAIADTVYGGRFRVANGPFREGSPWNQGVAFATHDPDRARELAADYEAEHGEPISFVLEISTDPKELQVAQEIDRQLGEVGITVEVSSVPAQQTTIDVAVGNYDMNVSNLLWGSQHPDREYFILHSDNAAPLGEIALNITRTKNPTIDAALDATRRTDDPAEQVAAWKTVQEQLAAENNFVFLVHNEVGEIARSNVRDITTWTFPDGTTGRPQELTILSLAQIWVTS